MNCCMKVRASKGRLYLSGYFPKKSGEEGTAQYMVTLQLDDDAFGQKQAAKLLKKAEKDLKNNRWNWDDWKINKSSNVSADGSGPQTWRSAIRSLYRRKVTLGRCSESSWKVNLWGTLKFMPMDETVTTASIETELNRYSRDTYTYKKLFYLLRDIGVITGTPFPEVAVPTYNRTATVYEIPDDDLIIEWVLKAGEPYRWYFGMMATYGLRPHEADECRLVEGNGTLLVQVDDNTKTGYRTVIPLNQEWVETFNLRDRTTRPESARDSDRNDAAAVWLNTRRLKLGIDFRPYMLRHAYAARLWRDGGSELTIDTAAKLMGHSVKEHTETYRRWIDPNQIAVSAMEAISRNKAKKVEAAERLLEQEVIR